MLNVLMIIGVAVCFLVALLFLDEYLWQRKFIDRSHWLEWNREQEAIRAHRRRQGLEHDTDF